MTALEAMTDVSNDKADSLNRQEHFFSSQSSNENTSDRTRDAPEQTLFEHSRKQRYQVPIQAKVCQDTFPLKMIDDEHALAEMEKVNPCYHLMGRNTPPSALTAL
jgi:hypothetical protein